MKRYLLFGGDAYYPSGGWQDLLGDFDAIPTVTARQGEPWAANMGGQGATVEWWFDGRRLDWFHVVDTTTGQVVAEAAKYDVFLQPDGCWTRDFYTRER